jgi:hypothetical protein
MPMPPRPGGVEMAAMVSGGTEINTPLGFRTLELENFRAREQCCAGL